MDSDNLTPPPKGRVARSIRVEGTKLTNKINSLRPLHEAPDLVQKA